MEKAVSRRTAVAGGAALALLTGILPRTSQAALRSRAIQSGGGVFGGGTFVQDDVTADFSLLATRFNVDGEEQPMIMGSVRWVDAAGFAFDSSEITSYGMIEGDVEYAREIAGTAKLATGEDAPFRIRVTDDGAPTTGGDSVHLTIGQSGFYIYEVEGKIASGDIQLIKFDFGVDA